MKCTFPGPQRLRTLLFYLLLSAETLSCGCTVQIVSAYRQPASSHVQYPPVGGSTYRGRPYVLPSPQQQQYYVSPGHSSLHGYSHHQPPGPVNDQIAYQLRPPTGVHVPGAPATGDQYAWKIAGFSECSQSCGGGFFLLRFSVCQLEY